MDIALDIHKVLVPKEGQKDFFKFLMEEAMEGPQTTRGTKKRNQAGKRSPGMPRLEEEIEEEEKKKEEKRFRKAIQNLLKDQEALQKIKKEKIGLGDKIEEKLKEEKIKNPHKKAERIQARLKEDLKDWLREQAGKKGLDLNKLRNNIKEYREKTGGRVYIHSTVPKPLSGALKEVVGADKSIKKWDKEKLEGSTAIDDRIKRAREIKKEKNINMKIKPFEIPEKPQTRLEDFGIEVKPEKASDLIKELEKAEKLQEKLEKGELRPKKRKKTKQKKIEETKRGRGGRRK